MKNLKIPLTVLLLLITNILFKGLFLGISPNSISLKEIELLMKVGFAPEINNYFFRWILIFLSALISPLTFIFIYKESKKYFLSLVISCVLIISPWLYITSRYFNQYLPLLFIIVSLYVIFPIRISRIITLIFTTIYSYFLINNNFLPTIQNFPDVFKSFITLIDFRTLFFQGDPVSKMFHTPLTGFFFYIDFIALITGLYSVYIKNSLNKNLFQFINQLLILGIFTFVLMPYDELLSVKAIGIFYYLSIVVGCGYYYLIDTCRNKLYFLRYVIILIVLINLIFFLELFFFHFDKHNSYEWGYAETKASEYIIKNQDKKIFLTDESNKINRFLKFFTKKTAFIISLKDAQSVCFQQHTVCIVREHELKLFGLEKDQIKTKFANYDGLPVYFVLTK